MTLPINTQYGFEWGPVAVIRHCSDAKKGWVAFGIKTNKVELQIYVTKTGKVRAYKYHGKELVEKK